MKKVFRKIHLWLSVPFGLIITLICFSGAALVFEKEVMECSRHDLYYVEKVGNQPLSLDQLVPMVAAILPDSVTVTGVSISSDPKRAYQMSLSKPRRASMYVDQYTGEVKGKYERSSFFMFMFRMHRWLLDSMKPGSDVFVGKMVVGVSTLIFVFVLVSGIVIWWPRTRKMLKNSLKLSVRKGWKRFWYDLHVAGGMYALILLLVMALTGLTWSFSWYRTGFYKVFGVELQQNAGHGGVPQVTGNKLEGQESGRHGEPGREGRPERAGNRFTAWQTAYEQLKTRNPEYKLISVSSGSANVSFDKFGNQRASDRYTFNPCDGEITSETLYRDTDKSGKIRGWIYSVHVGSWGGMFTRILAFIAALVGATLPLTGYYLWIRKWYMKKKQAKRVA